MMTPDFALQRLRLLASDALDLNLTPAELATVTRLDEVTGFNSLTILEFVAAVEKEFGCTLPPAELNAEFLTDLPRLAQRLSALCGEQC